jgi:hypothetical protein
MAVANRGKRIGVESLLHLAHHLGILLVEPTHHGLRFSCQLKCGVRRFPFSLPLRFVIHQVPKRDMVATGSDIKLTRSQGISDGQTQPNGPDPSIERAVGPI